MMFLGMTGGPAAYKAPSRTNQAYTSGIANGQGESSNT